MKVLVAMLKDRLDASLDNACLTRKVKKDKVER